MKLTIDVKEVLSRKYKHRNFYRWLSDQFEGSIIFESGTAKGDSAKAWAHNPSNMVLTCDIQERCSDRLDSYPNIYKKVFDVNQIDPRWFKNVDVIFLDISHNGFDEEEFLKRIEPHFKGILVMDDVNYKKRWDRLYYLFREQEKSILLPRSIGASRGTGVVPYGDWTVEVKE